MMTRQEEKMETKRRILASAVRQFLEKGYYKTTLSAIAKEAHVSFSSFQNIFGVKDGILLDLAAIMFDSQFEMARKAAVDTHIDRPVLVYAVETAIQMTLTELNENLREVYVETYSNPAAAEYIYQRTTTELEAIFAPYNPGLHKSDFYELEIGSAGIMRSFMARRCDQYFTLEKKLIRFLTMSLEVYHVPRPEIEQAVSHVLSLDIKTISNTIMHKLFASLAMQFQFELSE